jgi:tetratricopeptide (TPR) repeat protein
VVLWSAAAAASDWVKSEAGRAHRDDKLVNVLTPGTSWRDVPSPFDQYHFKELHDTEGILRSIDAVWTGRPVRTAVPLHEIYYRHHGQRLIDPKQRALPRDPREIGPSGLLQAPYEVVDYVDVSGVQAQFLEWCTQPGRATAGRLIHGPGGLGKTRLMVSLAAKLRSGSRKWTAGFFDRPRNARERTLADRWQALEQLIDHGDDAGLLIVVDYAEARQDEVRALAQRFCERPESDTRPVRLVLLARSAGEWWTTLHADVPEIQRVFRSDDPASVIELPAVSRGALRRALFEASLKAFAPRLEAQGVTGPGGTPSDAYLTQIETAPGFSRPLAIQMAALVWLTFARPAADATSVEELLTRVLGLERDHWRKILGNVGDERRRDLERAVAQVALVGGTPTSESAERLLMADDFYRGRRTARVDVDPVRRQLGILYGGPNGTIVSLEPDLVAEHHVASVGDKELIDGCVRWAEGEPPDAQEQRRQYVLTVLQRATQAEHGPHVSTRAIGLLEHLVEKHAVALARALVAVMVNEPGALVSVLDHSVDRLAPEALIAIDAVLPVQSVVLLDVSLKIAVRRVDLARHEIASASVDGNWFSSASFARMKVMFSGGKSASAVGAAGELANRLNNLGVRLWNLGRLEEAWVANQEAVAIYRQLAEGRPEVFLSAFALSLTNRGALLLKLGRHEEALAASQEAVAIYRRLAEARPEDFLSYFARSLSNAGVLLSKLGRYEEALAASQEAVPIHRRVAEARPGAFLPELAGSLNNLSDDLSNLGRHEEALATSQEGVAIRRRLAEAHPDAYLPDLARSLNSLAGNLSSQGQGEESLTAIHEAVAIRRRLAEARPAAFLPELAITLGNLGFLLNALGRDEEALAASQEAVPIFRRLAEARPNAFLPDLARTLIVLSAILEGLGRQAEAAAAAHQALEILAPFVEQRPAAFDTLARTIVRGVMNFSEVSSESPNFTLVERVKRALGDDPSASE